MQKSRARTYIIAGILLSIVIIGVLTHFFFFRSEGPSVYEKLFEHCVEENGLRRCYVFLAGYEEKEETTCMQIVLPVVDPSQRDIEICLDKEVNWENPYEDYSLNVPVVLNMYYDKNLFKQEVPQKINIEIMEDEKVYELLDKASLPSSENILVRTKKANENIVKGYTYYDFSGYEEEERYLVWVLTSVTINSIKEKQGGVEFQINFKMGGEEYSYTFISEEVFLHTLKTGEVRKLETYSSIIEHLNLNNNYAMAFSIFKLNDNQRIYEYYKGLEETIIDYFRDTSNSDIYLKLEEVTL